MKSRLPQLVIQQLGRYADALPRVTRRPGTSSQFHLRVAARRLQEVLRLGNWLFDSIRLIERNWRREVLAYVTPYDPAEEAAILAMYRQWSRPTAFCLAELKRLNRNGLGVPGAKQFRSNCATVRFILDDGFPFLKDPANRAAWEMARRGRGGTIRPVVVDSNGVVSTPQGERIDDPALPPDRILKAIDASEAGRFRPLAVIRAERDRDVLRGRTQRGG